MRKENIYLSQRLNHLGLDKRRSLYKIVTVIARVWGYISMSVCLHVLLSSFALSLSPSRYLFAYFTYLF